MLSIPPPAKIGGLKSDYRLQDALLGRFATFAGLWYFEDASVCEPLS